MFRILGKALISALTIMAWIFAMFNVSGMLFMLHELLGVCWLVFLMCLFVGMYGKSIKAKFG